MGVGSPVWKPAAMVLIAVTGDAPMAFTGTYVDEKREAFEKLAAQVRSIIR